MEEESVAQASCVGEAIEGSQGLSWAEDFLRSPQEIIQRLRP